MALAEARAAWQRTANRCLVQEDAKRAPKLACCPPVLPSLEQTDFELTGTADGQEFLGTGSLPVNQNSSDYYLSPDTRWLLHLQPSYGCRKDLIDGHFNVPKHGLEACQMLDTSGISARNNYEIVHHYVDAEVSFINHCGGFTANKKEGFIDGGPEFRAADTTNCEDPILLEIKKIVRELKDEGPAGCRVLNSSKSDISLIGTQKNSLQWQTADAEELALLIAQRSQNLVHNCDLPKPRSTCVNMDPNAYNHDLSFDGISTSPLKPKPNNLSSPYLRSHNCSQGCHTVGIPCQKLRMTAEGQSTSKVDWITRDDLIYRRMPETPKFVSNTSKAQLLEALRHSQTRAREADEAAKQAFAEKEHILKLVLRLASQLFAYKQWLQLLQLENMYFQVESNKSRPVSTVFPIMLPWIPQRPKKMRKSKKKSTCRDRARRFCLPQYNVGKYDGFALGLGLIGAGLLLGWSFRLLLPSL